MSNRYYLSGIHPDLIADMTQPYCKGIGVNGWMHTVVLPDGVREALVREFVVVWRCRKIVVPRGFVTDFASVPWLLRRVLPRRGRYSVAAVVHDWLYWSGEFPRDCADCALRDIARRLGSPWLVQWVLWVGVRVGGWRSWNRYRKARKCLN